MENEFEFRWDEREEVGKVIGLERDRKEVWGCVWLELGIVC